MLHLFCILEAENFTLNDESANWHLAIHSLYTFAVDCVMESVIWILPLGKPRSRSPSLVSRMAEVSKD